MHVLARQEHTSSMAGTIIFVNTRASADRLVKHLVSISVAGKLMSLPALKICNICGSDLHPRYAGCRRAQGEHAAVREGTLQSAGGNWRVWSRAGPADCRARDQLRLPAHPGRVRPAIVVELRVLTLDGSVSK